MEDILKCRFIDNSYGPENGLGIGDVETLKKEHATVLAREICQNSIDAKYGNSKTRVGLHLFEIEWNIYNFYLIQMKN